MSSTPTNATEMIMRLKQEIEKLTRQQAEALRSATYIGMTSEELQLHDARRQKITQLNQQLHQLRQAQ